VYVPRLIASAAVACALVACRREPKPSPAPTVVASAPSASASEPSINREDLALFFAPLPKTFAREGAKGESEIELGRMLYSEARLSKNHDLSCASCHDLSRYGVDGARISRGHKGALGPRNAPSVFNAGGHVAQFWDGRAIDLEEQAKGPILNPLEMASSEARVVATVRSLPAYVTRFRDVYGGAPTFDLVARAIASYERQLVTPGRFDRFVLGDDGALDAKEKRGLARFMKLGCPTCHNGAAIGGGSFQRIGLVNAWPDRKDLGRAIVTKKKEDELKFRVPSLRNVAETGPWFHDGSQTELPMVVRKMAWHQLGIELGNEDVESLVAFLRALTGELAKEQIVVPPLPPDAPTTPRPDPS
jgi:cytochrome c peroxidase